MYQLLQKTPKWTWRWTQAKPFQQSKEELPSSQVLAYYNLDLPIILDCNASPYWVGVVLSHQLGWRDDGYCLYTLVGHSALQRKSAHSSTNWVWPYIVVGIKNSHKYLAGCTVFIYSDHRPLQHIFTKDCPIDLLPNKRHNTSRLQVFASNTWQT